MERTEIPISLDIGLCLGCIHSNYDAMKKDVLSGKHKNRYDCVQIFQKITIIKLIRVFSTVFNEITCRKDFYKYGIEFARKISFENGLKPAKDLIAKLKEEKTQKGKFNAACSYINRVKVAINKSQ